jgi:hypothetical protein
MVLRRLLPALAMLLLTAPMTTAADDTFRAVADAWLAVVDKGQYAESWKEASAHFQAAITEAEWTKAVGETRGEFGAVVVRKFQSATHRTQLPGAPDGEYQVLQYQTKFAKKDAAIETLTMEWGGKAWKVAGYFIH